MSKANDLIERLRYIRHLFQSHLTQRIKLLGYNFTKPASTQLAKLLHCQADFFYGKQIECLIINLLSPRQEQQCAMIFLRIHEDKGDYNFFKQNHNTGYHKVQLELFFSQHLLYNSFFIGLTQAREITNYVFKFYIAYFL